jgi:hypothetical protein
MVLDGRRIWIEQPPSAILPDLIDDQTARNYCAALDATAASEAP